MKIEATFLDEISHDIPHQNWGSAEWDADFASMRAIGIHTVVLIRCGYRRWLTYPSESLLADGAFRPGKDLVSLFLELSEKHQMAFYFGLYDSGRFWTNGDYESELSVNRRVIHESWSRYGSSPAFRGWYLSQECSRHKPGLVELYHALGSECKDVSAGLPVLISPYIDGPKSVSQYDTATERESSVALETHESEWDEILHGIEGAVDTVAFQDGHVDFAELPRFLTLNKQLADRHGLESWTNSETFDRDMPIKFLPIKWEKLRLKLEAAAAAGIERAITFEFSHFLSPQSAYIQARHLYNRYSEWLQG